MLTFGTTSTRTLRTLAQKSDIHAVMWFAAHFDVPDDLLWESINRLVAAYRSGGAERSSVATLPNRIQGWWEELLRLAIQSRGTEALRWFAQHFDVPDEFALHVVLRTGAEMEKKRPAVAVEPPMTDRIRSMFVDSLRRTIREVHMPSIRWFSEFFIIPPDLELDALLCLCGVDTEKEKSRGKSSMRHDMAKMPERIQKSWTQSFLEAARERDIPTILWMVDHVILRNPLLQRAIALLSGGGLAQERQQNRRRAAVVAMPEHIKRIWSEKFWEMGKAQDAASVRYFVDVWSDLVEPVREAFLRLVETDVARAAMPEYVKVAWADLLRGAARDYDKRTIRWLISDFFDDNKSAADALMRLLRPAERREKRTPHATPRAGDVRDAVATIPKSVKREWTRESMDGDDGARAVHHMMEHIHLFSVKRD